MTMNMSTTVSKSIESPRRFRQFAPSKGNLPPFEVKLPFWYAFWILPTWEFVDQYQGSYKMVSRDISLSLSTPHNDRRRRSVDLLRLLLNHPLHYTAIKGHSIAIAITLPSRSCRRCTLPPLLSRSASVERHRITQILASSPVILRRRSSSSLHFIDAASPSDIIIMAQT
jgi:hypothetical protein